LLSSLLAVVLTALVWFPFFRLSRRRAGMAGADIVHRFVLEGLGKIGE
jgi:hypothetical protein